MKVYTGKRRLQEFYNSQRRLAIPGVHAYFVGDRNGRPLLYVNEKLPAYLGNAVPDIVAAIRQVVGKRKFTQNVERRFRVLKDFLNLRPIFHWTEGRVRGHVALCVLAATIEAVMAKDLVNAKVMDPDLPFHAPGLVFIERDPPRARLGRR